jgi:hypothetical protein
MNAYSLFSTIMAGLDPAIHAYFSDVRSASVDARIKSGHDE